MEVLKTTSPKDFPSAPKAKPSNQVPSSRAKIAFFSLLDFITLPFVICHCEKCRPSRSVVTTRQPQSKYLPHWEDAYLRLRLLRHFRPPIRRSFLAMTDFFTQRCT